MPYYICPNCGDKTYSAASPDHLRNPNCINCGAKVRLVTPEPDHDVMVDRWAYDWLMRDFRREKDEDRP
jgi:DNA-directed RNA polymerase subunit RPC12/RpoP